MFNRSQAERCSEHLIVEIGSDGSFSYNLMKFFANSFRKLTLLSVAGYLFLFAIAAKGVSLYASQHPVKEDLIVVDGIVKKTPLGGKGKSTRFKSNHIMELMYIPPIMA